MSVRPFSCHTAACLAALLLPPAAPAQVSDGKGLTPLEGVVAISDERALWDSVKDSRDANELQAYLAQFPKGLFATVAAIRIRAMGGTGPVANPQVAPKASGAPATEGIAAPVAGPSASYGGRLVARIRPNITFVPNLVGIIGNPGAEVEVRADADGTIISRKLLRSSGSRAWDEAVLKAIDKTETLPRDIDGRVPGYLEFTFRPIDQSQLESGKLAQKLESERVAADTQYKLAQTREVPVPAKKETCLAAAEGAGSGAGGANSAVAQVATTKKLEPDLTIKSKVIYFDYDSSAIKPEFQAVVESHARLLRAEKSRRVALEGHTDARGGREYNLALGQKRADAVRSAMSLLGVPDSQMEAVSFGMEKPAAQGSDEASLAKNRRVEIN